MRKLRLTHELDFAGYYCHLGIASPILIGRGRPQTVQLHVFTLNNGYRMFTLGVKAKSAFFKTERLMRFLPNCLQWRMVIDRLSGVSLLNEWQPFHKRVVTLTQLG